MKGRYEEMKIMIITRHNIINYGSVLQTMALQNILSHMGYYSEVIDYIRDDEDYRKIAKVLVERHPRWNRNIITKKIFVCYKNFEFKLAGKKFESMRKEYLNVTSTRYSTLAELQENPPIGDVYMTGSDQVWGFIGNEQYDPAFFLDFGDKNKKRVSYAASFGRVNISPDILEKEREHLNSYTKITVREESAKKMIEDMGFKDVEQVLDPTLLLTRQEWDALLCNNEEGFKYKEKKYVLVYQRRPNKKIDEYALALSKKIGLPLLRISSDLNQGVRGGKLIFIPTLSEFLQYIKNAAFLVTDSFHGTAFAINYNVQFVDILPSGTSTRNMSLLELTGLEDRVVSDFNDYTCIEKIIDFTHANLILTNQRKRSKEILNEMIDGCKVENVNEN